MKDWLLKRGRSNARFCYSFTKKQIYVIESQLLKKDAATEYLSSQFISSKSLKSQSSASKNHVNRNGNSNKIDDRNKKNPSKDSVNDKSNKIKVIVTGDSLLKWYKRKRFIKKPRRKNKNVPEGRSDAILWQVDKLICSKPNCLIVSARTNYMTCGIKILVRRWQM